MNRFLLLMLLACSGMLTSCLDSEEPFDSSEQFHKEQAAIDEYLKENGITAQKDSVHDLRYTVASVGSDDNRPAINKYITVSYTGKLLASGAVFEEGDSLSFLFDGYIIPGWRILLPYIGVGGEMTMYIPSFYAYGNNTVNDIPANSTLIFDVKLHRVEGELEYKTRTAEERFKAEQKLIDEYIEENDLTALIDTTESLRYVIKEEGTGLYPTATSKVNVNYTGKYLKDDKIFDSGTNADFNLTGLIKGWQILMPYVREGGTIIMFVPSKFGYGDKRYGNIPANSTVIFEVKLNEIKE